MQTQEMLHVFPHDHARGVLKKPCRCRFLRQVFFSGANIPPVSFVMEKSGGIALLLLLSCGYTPWEKQSFQAMYLCKGVLDD